MSKTARYLLYFLVVDAIVFDDWMLADIKYKTETAREALRTVLYIFAAGQWKVGDTGTLLK